ncbi:DUF3558 domain-containing protein [Streptomyces armeniacus]|uniref:DUF3558 domain-containing protein n=1 Tax=Streptomyces armeniacus TaxID=83291 RepID=A0A345XN76_9ACTN|nr:DUF3558 family protein [Streptomyces armeniacus]AXK33092.1 DUF3558 domain-containing protein [Streptomyces armeniacus]
MHRIDPRLARKIACAAVAVPVLLLAGCTGDSDGDGDDEAQSPSPSKSASVAPVKFKQLPDPCKTLSKGTVEDVVPGAQSEKGKNLASTDTESYGSCLWSGGSGKNNAEYRALTVSLKRYDSGPSLGSGDTQAGRFLKQEAESVVGNKDNKKADQAKVAGIGQEAVSIGYETNKKDQDYRISRTVVRNYNVVVTVDYEGTGFEDAKLPSADELKKKGEKAAREAVAAVK